MSWFSTKVRIVCLIEGEGAIRYMDSVHLINAGDYDGAWAKALQIGRKHEQEYRNASGMLVRWRLKEILSLDAIVAEELDGAEVFSEPVPLEQGVVIPFDSVFAPEESDPTQTI